MTDRVTKEQRQSILDLHAYCVPAAKIARKLRLPQATVLRVIEEARR